MRKKNLLAVAMLVMCASLAACGDSKKTEETPAQTQQETEAQTGYVYASKGLTMSIDGDVKDYVAKLGEPSGGYYEAKSCAFEGMDKFWYYDGFTLQGYQKDGKDLLFAITFDDDTVKTGEGVKIGDSKDKMTGAYGSGYSQNGNVYSYASGNMELQFTVKDDVVMGITYALKSN